MVEKFTSIIPQRQGRGLPRLISRIKPVIIERMIGEVKAVAIDRAGDGFDVMRFIVSLVRQTASLLPRPTMPKPATEKRIGGEYGDVRGAIDVEKLNAYLHAHVPEVAGPVTVQQFKVCPRVVSFVAVGLRLCRVQFGQVCSGNPFT